jgi:hypothetical protein
VPTTGGANALEGLRALSVFSHYSSDFSEELMPTSSTTGPQYRETKYPTRLLERSRLDGLTLWRRRLEDKNVVVRIISSSVLDTRGEGPSIQLQVEKKIEDLESNIIEVQRATVAELRLLAKNNMENRIIIENCGAIGPLIALLHYSDLKTQENVVTALLNLSINDNKCNAHILLRVIKFPKHFKKVN